MRPSNNRAINFQSQPNRGNVQVGIYFGIFHFSDNFLSATDWVEQANLDILFT